MPERPSTYDFTSRKGRQKWLQLHVDTAAEAAAAALQLDIPAPPDADAAEAANCDAYLKTQGLIVRQVGSYKLPHCLRITVGDEASCRRVAHAIGQFKGAK